MELGPQNFQLGLDGFVWWVGVVVSRQDPLAIGRCKVRIFGYHNFDNTKQSNEDLPWAYPLLPLTAATAVPNYTEGDWVAGFFLDGRIAQKPIVMGVFPALAQENTNG